MKYTSLRNALLATIGASCFLTHAPTASAETEKKEAAAEHKKGAAPTPASLVGDMQKAVAFIAKSAKDKISTKSKEASPFWSALKDSSKAIDELEAGVKAKDAKMLTGLDGLGMSLQQLSASWAVLDGSHEGLKVGQGVIALSKAYETYLFHFGPAVARTKMGGEITEEEKTQLVNGRAEVAKLQPQLIALEAKAKPKTYQQRLAKDLVILCEEMDKITGNDLKTYLKYLYQFNRLKYTVAAYNNLADAWYPAYAEEWKKTAPAAKSVGSEGGYAKTAVAYYKDWDYTSESVKHYGNYYDCTEEVSSSITIEEESTYESYTESYSEESATEESSEETAEINEEVSVDEAEDSTLAEDMESGGDDDSADDDGDSDDDGSADEDSGDDDGGDDE
ncbi:MAG: hypothetical protein ABIT37_05705 [Luteolibacter sp.]